MPYARKVAREQRKFGPVAWIVRFRATGTRYEKTATTFLALVHVACAWIWLS